MREACRGLVEFLRWLRARLLLQVRTEVASDVAGLREPARHGERAGVEQGAQLPIGVIGVRLGKLGDESVTVLRGAHEVHAHAQEGVLCGIAQLKETGPAYREIAVGQVVVGLAAIELEGGLEVGACVAEAPLAHVIQAPLHMVPELHLIDLLVFDVESVADTHEFDRVRAEDGAQVRDVGLQAAQLLRRG